MAITSMFSTFPHVPLHVSSFAFPISLGISNVSLGVSPCFLFSVLRGSPCVDGNPLEMSELEK